MVNENIKHQFIKTTIKQKTNDIISYIEKRGTERGIIFCRTKLGVQSLYQQLKEEGFSVGALEGDKQQRDREKAMRAFQK